MDPVLFLAATLRISIPYALASVGACFSERGGVINIALEGMMLNGALAYVLGANATGSAWAGVPVRSRRGSRPRAPRARHGAVSAPTRSRAGLGINLLAAGVTRFVLKQVFHSSSNSSRVPGSNRSPGAGAGALRELGQVFGSRSCSSRSRSCSRASGCCSARCSACGCARRRAPGGAATLGLSVGATATRACCSRARSPGSPARGSRASSTRSPTA
jgi:hypothetical protein